MVSGSYQKMRAAWKRPTATDATKAVYRARLVEWRAQPVIQRIDGPTRLDRARSLGYKAKPGIIVVRTRVRRGGLRKSRPNRKRKPGYLGVNKITAGKSIQRIGEERVQRKYPNLEVLASYWVGEDGRAKYYEVILVDPAHPAIQADKNLSWIASGKHSKRVFRGLTPAGKRGRGLNNKGIGAEKIRPSLGAHDRRGK